MSDKQEIGSPTDVAWIDFGVEDTTAAHGIPEQAAPSSSRPKEETQSSEAFNPLKLCPRQATANT
ncbi:hypothetical protein RJ641_020355 [Dillenia turbinata]|uniref:Uncharacterized protein n=1 Tax=Dillenia turbinata TaxID=194707 RepID=A0AAN8USL2_9MAGN